MNTPIAVVTASYLSESGVSFFRITPGLENRCTVMAVTSLVSDFTKKVHVDDVNILFSTEWLAKCDQNTCNFFMWKPVRTYFDEIYKHFQLRVCKSWCIRQNYSHLLPIARNWDLKEVRFQNVCLLILRFQPWLFLNSVFRNRCIQMPINKKWI